MDNRSKTLVKGLLAVLTFILANEHTMNSSETDKMLLAGILGVLSLVFSNEQMFNAVQDVNIKKYCTNGSLLSDLNLYDDTLQLMKSCSFQGEERSSFSRLTTRENEVLCLMAEGATNKDIARKLYVSEATIKNHVTSILRKLNASVRTEAVVTAIKYGLVSTNNVVPKEKSLCY